MRKDKNQTIFKASSSSSENITYMFFQMRLHTFFFFPTKLNHFKGNSNQKPEGYECFIQLSLQPGAVKPSTCLATCVCFLEVRVTSLNVRTGDGSSIQIEA